MFVKTRRARQDGWSTYLNVSEVHTDWLAFDKFEEHADVKFDYTDKDVRWNIRYPPDDEIDRIDNHEQMSHGFVVITITFLGGKQPMSLFTNTVTYLCEDNGNTSQKLY